MSWGEIFEKVESIKKEHDELILEYTINETMLEQVFLTFARQQYPQESRSVNISMLRKILTCQICPTC